VIRVTLVPISRELHGKTRVRPLPSFAFAARTTVVPVYGSEIVPMSHEVPIVFIREGDAFVPSALVGLRAGQNLMIDPRGRWIGTHIPAVWRRGPFRLARVANQEGGENRMVLCLDDSSDLISETEGNLLFDEHGAPSPLVSSATTLLSQLERDSQATRAICALIDRLGLIVPWNLDVAQADGTKQRVSDLYQVDESKIGTLTGEDLVHLRDAGALPLIYAHLLSLSKAGLLGRLAKIADELTQQQNAVQKGNLNLDRAFGIVEDDPFIF
jgi:hypothetical protein